eukprot:9491181-Pyramimonas_sp.AAC.1
MLTLHVEQSVSLMSCARYPPNLQAHQRCQWHTRHEVRYDYLCQPSAWFPLNSRRRAAAWLAWQSEAPRNNMSLGKFFRFAPPPPIM